MFENSGVKVQWMLDKHRKTHTHKTDTIDKQKLTQRHTETGQTTRVHGWAARQAATHTEITRHLGHRWLGEGQRWVEHPQGSTSASGALGPSQSQRAESGPRGQPFLGKRGNPKNSFGAGEGLPSKHSVYHSWGRTNRRGTQPGPKKAIFFKQTQ